MEEFKVLVTDYEYDTLEPEKRVMDKIGAKLLTSQCQTEEEVIEKAPKNVDGLISQYAPIGEKVFRNLQSLEVVARYGIGVDTINLEAASNHDVCVVNVAQYCQDEVADHVLALLLALGRKIVLLDRNIKNGNWDLEVAKPIKRIEDGLLGLIGFGSIAQNLSQKASAFGLEVLVYDPYVEGSIVEENNAKHADLDKLLHVSDYISMHTPLNKETRYMIGKSELEKMKKSAILINTSRGEVVDEKALVRALRGRDIAAAGLDVTEKEPIGAENPLLELDNVVITPHVAWYSEESKLELKTKAAQGIADVLKGEKPTYLVNEDVWDG